jgi:hypothetical protein
LGIGYWALDIGQWSLVVGHWLLVRQLFADRRLCEATKKVRLCERSVTICFNGEWRIDNG